MQGSVAVSNLIQHNGAEFLLLNDAPAQCAFLHTPHNETVCIVMTYMGINKLLTAMQVVRSNFVLSFSDTSFYYYGTAIFIGNL